MIVKNIYFSTKFKSQFVALPRAIKQKAVKAEALLRDNPFHPSLRLHKLKGKLDGCWSITVDYYYRIIFGIDEKGNIVFLSIGTHSIY